MVNYSKQSDFQLLCRIKKGNQKALHEMHSRYLRLFIKQRLNLEAKCREMGLGVDTGDYMGETYQSFLNAMNTMNIDRISEPKNSWGAWYVINGYLRSKNRDIIHALLKDKKSTMMLDDGSKQDSDDYVPRGIAKSDSVEEDYFHNETKVPFWQAVELSLSSLNDTQKQLWSLLSNNTKKKVICQELGLSTYEFNKHLQCVRDVFKRNLQYTMKTMDTKELKQLLA